MWTRYNIKCHVCEKVTNMRIQIPNKDTFPVKFPCLGCETEISGVLTVDFENISYHFEIERGELVDLGHDAGDFFVEISDTLPTKKPSTSPHEMRLPTFRLKDSFKTKEQKDLKVFLKDEDWEILKDLCVAYRNFNKQALQKLSSDLLAKFGYQIPKFEIDIEYHNAFFNCINFIIGHWLNTDFEGYVNFLKDELYNKEEEHFEAVRDFFTNNFDDDILAEMRAEFCDLIIRFIENRDSFLFVYKDDISDDSFISNENFVVLKNFFTDCFETLGKRAELIFRLQNILERGDENTVPTDAPRDIIDAQSLSNRKHGNKLEVLDKSQIPQFEEIFSNDSFDHRLRNGINHQKAHLNKREQIISYYPITARPDQEFTITYHDFLKKALFSFSGVYSIGQLIFFAYLNQVVR